MPFSPLNEEPMPVRPKPSTVADPPSNSRQRRLFTRAEQDQIISELTTSQRATVEKKWHISSVSLNRLLKGNNRDRCLATLSQANPQRKRQRVGSMQMMEATLVAWLREAGQRDGSVTGPMIQTKAIELAKQLSVSDRFNASDEWLNRFKHRHRVTVEGTTIHWKIPTEGHSSRNPEPIDQSESVMVVDQSENAMVVDQSEGALSSSLSEHELDRSGYIRDLLANHANCDVFSVTVTSLLFQLTPDCIPPSGSFADDTTEPRLTILLCCNADGTEKLPPLVIGRHFRSLVLNGVAAQFRHHPRAWMTREVFRDWLLRLDRDWARAGRHGMVLADGSPAHDVADVRLRNAHFELLAGLRPSEGPHISRLSPALHSCIVRGVKTHYRRYQARQILATDPDDESDLFSLKDSIEAIVAAWNSISPAAIAAAWNCGGLRSVSSHEENAVDQSVDDRRMWRRLSARLGLPKAMTFDHYVACDDDVSCEEDMHRDRYYFSNERELVEAVLGPEEDEAAMQDDDEDAALKIRSCINDGDASGELGPNEEESVVMGDEEKGEAAVVMGEDGTEKEAAEDCSRFVSTADAFTCVEMLRAFLVRHPMVVEDGSRDGLDAIEDFIASCVVDDLAEGGEKNNPEEKGGPRIENVDKISDKESESTKKNVTMGEVVAKVSVDVVESPKRSAAAAEEVVQQPADTSFEDADDSYHSGIILNLCSQVAKPAAIQPSNNVSTSGPVDRAPPAYHSLDMSDPDVLYALSLVGRLKHFSPKQKALAQLRMQEVLFAVEFNTT